MKSFHTVAIAALLLSTPVLAAHSGDAAKAIAAAIADPARPADDVKREIGRAHV